MICHTASIGYWWTLYAYIEFWSSPEAKKRNHYPQWGLLTKAWPSRSRGRALICLPRQTDTIFESGPANVWRQEKVRQLTHIPRLLLWASEYSGYHGLICQWSGLWGTSFVVWSLAQTDSSTFVYTWQANSNNQWPRIGRKERPGITPSEHPKSPPNQDTLLCLSDFIHMFWIMVPLTLGNLLR